MKILYVLLMAVIVQSGAKAQEVSNLRAETKGNLVIINYDLAGSLPGQLFGIKVFVLRNGQTDSLLYVRGDVGRNVVPGRGKRIEWGAKKEIGVFDNTLAFRVEATLTFSPIALKNPAGAAMWRRGKGHTIDWAGGVENEDLQLELWKDSTLGFIITRTANQGKYDWQVPVGLAPGDDYKIRLASVAAPTNFRFSEPFSIRRKIPLAAKLIPVGVAVGVGTWLLVRRLSEPAEPDLPPPDDGLPK